MPSYGFVYTAGLQTFRRHDYQILRRDNFFIIVIVRKETDILLLVLKINIALCDRCKILKPKQCKLECGPMPNLMVALPNIGGALCSTPQSLADAHY